MQRDVSTQAASVSQASAGKGLNDSRAMALYPAPSTAVQESIMKRFHLDHVTRALIIATASAWSLGAVAQGAQPAQPGTPPAAQQPGAVISPAVQAAFKKADADGDGRVSRDEASKAGMAADKFDLFDKNKDGLLDIGEFSAASMK
jgi:EF hand